MKLLVRLTIALALASVLRITVMDVIVDNCYVPAAHAIEHVAHR